MPVNDLAIMAFQVDRGRMKAAVDKTIRRVTNLEEQQAETYWYWQSLPPGERLSAVCEASIDGYAFKGLYIDASQ